VAKVTVGDKTVMPMARVRYGFGGGGGKKKDKSDGGSGGMMAKAHRRPADHVRGYSVHQLGEQ
jgi:uncharacterized spore protein YtfJ